MPNKNNKILKPLTPWKSGNIAELISSGINELMSKLPSILLQDVSVIKPLTAPIQKIVEDFLKRKSKRENVKTNSNNSATKIIELIKGTAADKITDEIAREALPKISQIFANISKFTNHPYFYFPEKAKVSGMSSYQTGENNLPFMNRIPIRHMVWDPALAATAIVGEENTANYKDFVKEFLFPGPLNNFAYNAYRAFYARLSLTAPKSQAQFTEDISAIMWTSFVAIAATMEEKRNMDAQLFKVDGTIVGPAFTQVNFNGLVSWRDNTTSASEVSTVTSWMRKARGWYPDEDPNDKSRINLLWQDNVDAAVQFDTNYDYDVPSISNKKWTEHLSKMRSLPISPRALHFAKYLFSVVFEDNAGEDYHEFYVFHAPRTNIISGGGIPHSGNSYWNIAEGAYTLADNLIMSDRAYKSILTMLGLLGDETTQKAIEEILYKRDPMSNTLNVQMADNSLYTALVNATYAMPDLYSSDEEVSATSSYDLINIDINGQDATDKVVYGTRKLLRTHMTSLIPDFTTLSAGEIASALKFRYFGTLFMLPCTVWNSSSMKWYLVQPPHTAPLFRFEAITSGAITAQASINYSSITSISAASYDSFAELSWYIPILPAELKLAYTVYYEAANNPTGEEDENGNPIIATEFNITEIDGKHTVNQGYDIFTLRDFNTLNYMWANMFYAVDSIEEIQKKFEALELMWAIQ